MLRKVVSAPRGARFGVESDHGTGKNKDECASPSGPQGREAAHKASTGGGQGSCRGRFIRRKPDRRFAA